MSKCNKPKQKDLFNLIKHNLENRGEHKKAQKRRLTVSSPIQK